MVDLNDVFKTPDAATIAEMVTAGAIAQVERIPVQMTAKQARNLVKLHNQLAQAYQNIPGCAEVSINHRKEATAIGKMLAGHLKRLELRGKA